MNPVAASRLRMMLAAGKHRLEEKAAKSKEEKRLARAEAVLARYQDVHGPLTHETPEHVLQLARLVAHDRAKLDNPRYVHFLPHIRGGKNEQATVPPRKNAFDPAEFRTRQIEARAADPEKFEREKVAERRRQNGIWFAITERRDFDKCNADLAEIRPVNRLLDIWAAIVLREQSEKLDNIHLRQEDRIANAQNQGRVRGVGRAARLAGF